MLKLTRYLKPYLLSIVAVAVLVFLQSISQLYLPNLMSEIVDVGIVSGDTNYILRVGARMLLVAALGAACTIGISYLSSRAAAAFGSDLRLHMFEKVSSFSLTEFARFGNASLITRTTNDIMQMQQVVVFGLRMALMTPMMLVGGIIMALATNVKLTLSLAAIIPILAVIIGLVGSKGMPLFRAMQDKLDNLNRVLREHLTGIRVIRAFNRGTYEEQRFDEANLDLTQTAIRVNRLMAVIQPIFLLLFNFLAIAVLWFGSLRVDQGSLQVGSLMAFIQYA
ncbi:MAG: ABC transporter ATP-binding protein, partial [Firmicutes bacterium]|nr:ABC transporter ATP-binding protein [Bacillota bacterium]